MSTTCTTEKELAKAIKSKEEEILIEGDLTKDVFRIKATGKVAWAVCAGSLAAAIAFYIVTPAATVAATPAGGGALFVGGTTMTAVAATALGSAVVPAVLIGVAAGGIGALTTLRKKYKIIEKGEKYLKLKRKK